MVKAMKISHFKLLNSVLYICQHLYMYNLFFSNFYIMIKNKHINENFRKANFFFNNPEF